MSIQITQKHDYSNLFSSLNNRSSNNLLNNINLSDYKSIKSGTYHKLLSSYYKKSADDTKSEKTDTKTETNKKTTASSYSADGNKIKSGAEIVGNTFSEFV